VEKLALICNSASGGTFSSTAIEIINRLKFAVAKAKMFLHLEAGVRVGRRIPHVKGYTTASLFQRINAFKKTPVGSIKKRFFAVRSSASSSANAGRILNRYQIVFYFIGPLLISSSFSFAEIEESGKPYILKYL
jgi:hypothetical protein